MSRYEWRECLISSKEREITWIYTPGHAGVKGNVRADELAGNAPMQGHLSMGLQEVLTVFEEPAQPAIKSDTLQRVVDSGYKKGTGRKERLAGTHRCHINQLLTSTISLPTLVIRLEGGARVGMFRMF